MNEQGIGHIYQKIAETVVAIIQEDWTKVFLYGEVLEGSQRVFFFYYSKDGNEIVYCRDIPELFNLSLNQYKELLHNILDDLQELQDEFSNNGQEVWTSLTMAFDNTGEFNIDYNYEDLSEADDNERDIVWEYKYLGIIPEDEDDKKFLEEYLKSIEEKTEE